MKVFVLDNYDSFTFNLVQLLGALDVEIDVRRHDEVAPEDIDADAVVISPGPGEPQDAGISIELVKRCAKETIPLLGVCLGHQAIAAAFGADIVRGPAIMHGKTSLVHHDASGIFDGMPDPFEAMRYHSLVVDPVTLSREFVVSAWSDDVVMGIRHMSSPIEGVQFHPESILTPDGAMLLRNFLRR